MTTKNHLTPHQLAERLQMQVSTIARWRKEGTGPEYVKCGRATRYPLDAVEAWERKHRHISTSAHAHGN